MRHAREAILVGGMLLCGSVFAAGQQALPHELFERLRETESESHRARVQILEAADRCIREAEDFRAYRACEEVERTARKALRERLQPTRDALRQDFRNLRAAR